MIVIKVELWSAITGAKTELARMHIANTGESGGARRNYTAQTLKGRSMEQLERGTVQRETRIEGYPALAIHVWNLVACALRKMGYGWAAKGEPSSEGLEDLL